jgi:protein-arginine kinase activator protein McsA
VRCEKCQQQDATVHLTLIEPSAEVSNHHFCEPCYAKAQGDRGRTHDPAAEVGVTQPTPKATETTFVKKPKFGRGKPKQRKIPAGPSTGCERCGAMVLDK